MNLLKDEQLSHKLIKQWFRVYFFSFLIAPTGYIFRIVLSQKFDVSTVGVFYSILSFLTVLTMYNDLGLSHSLKYFLPTFYLQRKYDAMKTSLLLTLLMQLGSAFLIIAFLWGGWAERLSIHHFHNSSALPVLRVFLVYFLGINLYEVITIVMRAFQDVWHDNISYVFRMRSTTIFVILFFFCGVSSLMRYVWAWVLGLFLGLFYALFIFSKKYWATFSQWIFSLQSLQVKKYFHYALWIFLWSNAGILMSHVDQQMVVNMLWDYSAWIYANYLSLFNAFTYVVWPLVGILFPIVVELRWKGETQKMEKLYALFFNYLFILSLFWSLMFIVFWPNIASILFWWSFSESWQLLRFAAIFLPFFTINSICATLLSSTWKIGFYVKITLFAAFLNVALNYFLIPHYGLYGSVFSTMFNWMLVTIVSYFEIRSDYRVRWEASLLLRNFVGMAIAWFVLYWVFYWSAFIRRTGIIYYDFLFLLCSICFVAIILFFLNRRTLLQLYREVRLLQSTS